MECGSVICGDKDISDHRVVWLKLNFTNWGQNLLRFLIVGIATHNLMERFKVLRERLRWWNKCVFGWVDLKVEEEVGMLNEIEVGLDIITSVMSKEDLKLRSVTQAKI